MINENPLAPSIEDTVSSNLWNTQNGQPTPETPILEPLKLKPFESFKYQEALDRGLSPTQIVDLLGSRLGMDISTARDRAKGNDELILQSLMDNSEKAKKNLAIAKATNTGLDTDFKKGLANSVTGIAQTMNSILNSAYIRDDETYKKTKESLTKFSEDLDRGIEDKDFFSMATLGDVAGQIAALPMAGKTKLGIAITEGALGFASGFKKADTGEALATAAAGASLGVALSQIYRTLSGEHLKDLNNRIKKQYLGTEENLAKFEDFKSEYDKVVKVDNNFKLFTPTTYTKANDKYVQEASALVDYLGVEGSTIKSIASEDSLLADASIRLSQQERSDAVTKVLDTVGIEDLEKVNDSLNKGFDVIFDDFGRVIDSMGVVKSDNSKLVENFSEDALSKLDEATSSDLRNLKDLLQDDTVNSLVEARKLTNAIIRSTSKNKRARKFELDNLLTKIDDKILKEVGTDKYIEFKSVNEDYAKLANIRDSKVNTLIKGAQSGKITAEKAMSELYKVSEGKQLFKDIEDIIGTKQTETLEKLMIKEALGTNSLDTWKKLSTQISNKGFITPEGVALQDTIKKFGELFQVDDITQLGNGQVKLLSAGAKTSVTNQGLSLLVKETFDMIQQALPWTDAFKRSAMNNHFTNVLKDPAKLKQFVEVAGRIKEPIKARMVKDVIKKLPSIPEPRKGGIENLEKPAGPNKVFEASIKSNEIEQGLVDAFKDAMFSKLEQETKNKIVDKAFSYFNHSRLKEKLSKVEGARAEEMKKAIIKGEAELMYQAIRKDAGLDPKVVDKQMMETLVKYVSERL